MPNGPTTYPTLATTARRLVANFPRSQYPATVDELNAVAEGIDAMAADLAKTRAELEDMTKLAGNRLAAMDDLRVELVTQRRLTQVANQRVADRTHKLTALASYATAQPCMCPTAELRTDPNAEPCDRCLALGRVLDEPVDQ